jgi:hypothetical protein
MLNRVADCGQSVLKGVTCVAHGGEIFGRVDSFRWPEEVHHRERAAVSNNAAERLIGSHSVRTFTVKRSDEAVEFVAFCLEVASCLSPILLGCGFSGAPRFSELFDDDGFLGFRRVDLEAIVAKPDLLHSPADDFEGRGLLGHEEDGACVSEAVRDHIHDGLAFAGSGRPEENVVFAALNRDNRRDLG